MKKLKKKRPKKIVLDLDSTDDQTHGQQEFSFYHGYFRHYVLHPLLMFDGETGDLLAAVLRGGNRGAAYRAVSVLRRIVERICEEIRENTGPQTAAMNGQRFSRKGLWLGLSLALIISAGFLAVLLGWLHI